MSEKSDKEQAAQAEKREDAPIENPHVMVDTSCTSKRGSLDHAFKVDEALRGRVEKALAKENPNGRKAQVAAAKAETDAAAEAVADDPTVGEIKVFITGTVNGERHSEKLTGTPSKEGKS